MNYKAIAPPLVPGFACPSTRVCVIIPARNEERFLSRTLDALYHQYNFAGLPIAHDTYEVLLLLNNCIDASLSMVRSYQQTHPGFSLHVATRTLSPEDAHVGTARRLLMDTANHRLQHVSACNAIILSTDADTVVARDWIAANIAAIEAGADVVGGVIHLFPDEYEALKQRDPGTCLAYQRDRQLQRLVAELESILDPDPSDPWPRHLQHFGASLACTTSMYVLSGGLPPVKTLEDIAFIDALRKVGARIRHCPKTHIYTSARLEGRAQVGLSGQLNLWRNQAQNGEPHQVDSGQWMEHRFRSLAALRRINEASTLPSLCEYPDQWRSRISTLHRSHLPTPRFLELLDCNALIEELFAATGSPRHADITEVISALTASIQSLATAKHPDSH
jgi:hypothetical protein